MNKKETLNLFHHLQKLKHQKKPEIQFIQKTIIINIQNYFNNILENILNISLSVTSEVNLNTKFKINKMI